MCVPGVSLSPYAKAEVKAERDDRGAEVDLLMSVLRTVRAERDRLRELVDSHAENIEYGQKAARDARTYHRYFLEARAERDEGQEQLAETLYLYHKVRTERDALRAMAEKIASMSPTANNRGWIAAVSYARAALETVEGEPT